MPEREIGWERDCATAGRNRVRDSMEGPGGGAGSRFRACLRAAASRADDGRGEGWDTPGMRV